MNDWEKTEVDAAHWIAREDRGFVTGEREELSSWLENTSNRVAYLRLKNSWERSTKLAVLKISLAHRIGWTAWPHKWHALAIATGLLVLAGTTTAVMHFRQPTQEVFYATQAGERPTIHLVDGTQIQLDANSRLRATISSGKRSVTLEKGEAYFEVVHDAGRPFVVLAGKHRISDLGTKFSVLKEGDSIRVVVTEGRVRVDDVSTLTPKMPIFADGGNVLVAKANEILLTTLNPQDLADDLGWRDGRLIFNQVTLAEAAKDFNRYNNQQLVVTGAAREIRVGGSFRADNIDVFAGLIGNSLGLTVENRGNTIVLSKK